MSLSDIQKLADRNFNGFEGLLIMFDDGYSNIYGGYEYALARGICATVYVQTEDIGTATFLTSAQLQTMDASIWLVASHTTGSTPLQTLNLEEQTTAIGDAIDDLNGWGVSGAYHLSYPGGGDNADTITAMSNLSVLTGRDTNSLNSVDPLIVDANNIGLCMGVANSDSLQDVKDVIDVTRNRGKYCTILFHGLVDSGPGATQWLNSQFESLIDWIVSEGIGCITMVDFYAEM